MVVAPSVKGKHPTDTSVIRRLRSKRMFVNVIEPLLYTLSRC